MNSVKTCNSGSIHLREYLAEAIPFSFFQRRNFPAGKILLEEGSTCEYAVFIVSGRVAVKKKTEFKGNHIILGIYGEGACVGALSILDDSPGTVTAQALDDVSVVIITRENFERLMKMYPEIGAALMKGMLLSVSKRLNNSFDRLVAIF